MIMDDSNHLAPSKRPPQIPNLNSVSNSNNSHYPLSGDGGGGLCGLFSSLSRELVSSSELLLDNKLNWLLLMGPLALLGDATGLLGEAGCFALAGMALIPCAER